MLWPAPVDAVLASLSGRTFVTGDEASGILDRLQQSLPPGSPPSSQALLETAITSVRDDRPWSVSMLIDTLLDLRLVTTSEQPCSSGTSIGPDRLDTPKAV